MKSPVASVIIPVYRNTEGLRPLLQSLKRQTYPQGLNEVIIVNNDASTDFADIKHEFDFVRIVREEKEGSYAARNKGIRIAKGDIIAFTDADCIPARDWLENGVLSLRAINNKGMIAGHIEVTFLNPSNPNACELYDALCSFRQKEFIEENKFGVTANLFTSKTTIENVGVFDSRLVSGGDCEWGYRVFRRGFLQRFCANTVIRHPARRSLRSLILKGLRVTTGTMKTRERYKYTEKNIMEYAWLHLFKRPSNLIKQMNGMELLIGFDTKIRVLGIYFLIKGLQLLERARVLSGGKPLR